MYIDYNILDDKIIENVLRFSEIKSDLTLEELMNIIDNKERYSVIYTEYTKILHVNDNQGLLYFDINIDILNKKILLLFIDNTFRHRIISYNLSYNNSVEEVNKLLIDKYNS